MSKNGNSGVSAEHRLFHAIVLMGGSVALGCGGEVTDAAGGPDDSSAAGGKGDGSAGSGGSGSSGSSSGGRAASGGTIAIGGSQNPPPPQAGGAPSAGSGGAGSMPSLPCPPAQWRCNPDGLACDYSIQGYDFPTDCTCDPGLPVRAEDCGPGRLLACDLAVTGPDGTRLDAGIPFGCACVDASLACDVACQDLGGGYRQERSCVEEREVNGMVQYLCGCALIVLR